MNIRELIKDILQKHEVLILPEFGGFIAEFKDAKVDTVQNRFEPPRKIIRFDSKLKKDEKSVLEKYLIEKFRLGHKEASDKVHQFIEEIKNDLSISKEVEFNKIGVLRKDEKGEIIFNPIDEENLLLESFGLDSFTHKTFVKPHHKTSAMAKNNKYRNKVNWEKLLRPVIWIPVAVIILLVGLIIFTDVDEYVLSMNFNNLFERKDKFNIEFIESEDESGLSKSLDEQTDPSVALQIGEDNIDNTDDKYANFTEFYIIAGSFTQFKNAEELRLKLINKGYQPEIILSEEKRYRVALKSFDDRQVALKEFENLKNKDKDLNIWLLSI